MGQQVAVDLGDGVHRHRHDDQERRAAELQQVAAVLRQDELRDQADADKVGRAQHGQAREHVVDVFGRLLARANARNEAAVLLQIVGGVGRIEDDRGVEERKEDDQQPIEPACRAAGRGSAGAPTSVSHSGAFCALNEAIVIGNTRSDDAKIGGITPEVLIFSGRCELC